MNAPIDIAQYETPAPTPAPQPQRQMTVVEYAVQSGAPVSEVRALVEAQIQMDNHKLAMLQANRAIERENAAEAARIAFAEAMAAFKGESVKVIRTQLVNDGPLKGKKYADLFSVVNAATEAMSKHGLSATWKTLQDDKDWIRVACVIKHVAGHSEETAFGGPVDTGGSKNPIQARKSTVSYLNRITMLLGLGLAEQDDDTDGNAVKLAMTGLADDQVETLIEQIKSAPSLPATMEIWEANNAKLVALPEQHARLKAAVAARREDFKALKRGAK